ncbi:Probable enoyl-CoA hydratase/isomerase [Mycobacteroides abscessus]|nr:Probable enoyl-CoA hydratase/isomerase [Mycobacteroides abscessus]
MSDYETLRIRRDGYVLVIGLNRPAKRNAFDKTMFEELALALGEYETDIDLRAAVLYGEGPMFTAGLDLASVAAEIQGGASLTPEGGITRGRSTEDSFPSRCSSPYTARC